MSNKSTIIMEIYFSNKHSRGLFIQLIEKETDWKYTAHGDSKVPNSLSVRLYHVSQKDLNMLNALLFRIEVEDETNTRKVIEQIIPKRLK